MDDSESKRVNFNACYTDKSKSKSVHKIFNTSKVKYANDEEPLVTNILLIKAPGNF